MVAFKLRKKLLQLLYRMAERHVHILAEFFLMAELLCVTDKKAELPDGVLDIMQDESKTFGEFRELPCVGQGLGCFLLDQISGKLKRYQPDKIMVFPIQIAVGARLIDQRNSNQRRAIAQRDQEPGSWETFVPKRRGTTFLSRKQFYESAILVIERCERRIVGRKRRQFGAERPVGDRHELMRAIPQHPKRTTGTVENLGEGPQDPKRDFLRIHGGEGPDELGPFEAVIIFVAEEILIDEYSQPRPKGGRGRGNRDGDSAAEAENDRQNRRRVPAIRPNIIGSKRRSLQQHADNHQGCGVKDDFPRRMNAQIQRWAAHGRDDEKRQHQQKNQRTRRQHIIGRSPDQEFGQTREELKDQNAQ